MRSETPAPKPSPAPQPKATPNPEALVIDNGNLVENLLNSQEWKQIAFPLLLEMVASVSGRYTNGRFYKGEFTKTSSMNLDRQSGYQTALEDFNNNLHDFIVARNNLLTKKKTDEADKQSPIINPFLEDNNEQD